MKRIVLALLVGIVCCSSAFSAAAQAKKKVVFIAGRISHGFGAHEHNAGCRILAKAINESGLPIEASVIESGAWPADPVKAFEGVSAIIMYSDGGGGHMVVPHLKAVDALNDKGVGIGCIHYAVEVEKEKGGAEFLKWIGGYFEKFYSVNPHWRAYFTALPKHAVTSGVKPFWTNDEWYYHMRFRENMDGVTPILTAVPPDATRRGKDSPHGGNEHVRAGLGKNIPEHVMWVSENKNGTRGFGCTGGHNHINWWKDEYRKTILNAIVWTAKVEVPAEGVKSERPTAEEYLNQDKKKMPEKFSLEEIKQQIEEMNKPLDPAAVPAASAAGK
jgi:type 1 glutamine amidotransferase